MSNNNEYPWTDNPTEAGVADCDPDVLNDCLMYLRYNAATGNGIPPMGIKNKEIIKTENQYKLTWEDPEDSIIDGVELATWGGTLIVRKAGDYPEDHMDGVIVCDNKVRNKYAITPFVDDSIEEDDTNEYFYRAFPYTVNKVYNFAPLNKFGAWLYGYCELDNEATPGSRITYLEENKNYKPCKMNFTSDLHDFGDWQNSPLLSWNNLRPCMLYNASSGQNGTVAYYLDPNNLAKIKDSDTDSDIANANFAGNAMVEVRRVFTKTITKNDETGRKTYVYFSNVKIDSGFECWPCKRADGTYNDFFYMPIYNGSFISNVCRSLSGQTVMSGKNAQTEIDAARANGDGWDTETRGQCEYFKHLFKLLYKTSDSQTGLGAGKSNGGNNVEACLKTGTMNDKGIMYGSSSNAVGIKFCYMENWWGSQWRRYRGHVVINGVHYVKMTKSNIDGSGADDYNITGEGYIPLNDVPAASGSSGGYCSKMQESGNYGSFNVVMSGSSTTYSCDGGWFNNSGTMYPYRGGSSDSGAFCGVSCFASNYAASHTGWYVGAALSYTPL